MELINYVDINCDELIDKTNTTITFNGHEIQIVNYLSTDDKYDLIMITLQKAFEKNIYNPFKMDIYFDLNVIYLYTNIVFSTDDRIDEGALYDTLKRSGLIDAVKEKIPAEELAYLKDCVIKLSETIIKYRNTFGAVVGGFIEMLPDNMEKAKEIIGSFDPEKYQELITLASKIKAGTLEESVKIE